LTPRHFFGLRRNFGSQQFVAGARQIEEIGLREKMNRWAGQKEMILIKPLFAVPQELDDRIIPLLQKVASWKGGGIFR